MRLSAIFQPSLRARLVWLMLFMSMSLVTILVFFYYQTEQVLFNEFQRKTSELTRAVQIGLEGASASKISDDKSLEKYLSSLNRKGVKEISIISSSDRIVASTSRDNVGKWISQRRKELIFKAELGQPVTGEGPVYNVVIPVTSADGALGYIHLTLDAEDFSGFIRLSLVRRVVAALVILSIGTIMALALAGHYARPLEQVVKAAKKVADGDLDHGERLPVQRRDEIGMLARSFSDMVERLRMDRDLSERLRRAEHLAGIGQVARSVAHEIKNPLNFISLSIDHMLDTYRPSEAERSERFESLVGNIKGEILRISSFAESFLEYGRPIEINCRPTDVAAMLDAIFELVMPRAEQDQIILIREYAGIPQLNIDPELLRTCFYNLVINAFDAMPEGGELRVVGALRPDGISLTFADTGTGIPRAAQDKIFEPYFTTKIKGIGLGLPLTRKIVEEHGGRIMYEPRAEVGSRFIIHLPLPDERHA